jgi:DNA-binding XRE family transcriptional regulator
MNDITNVQRKQLIDDIMLQHQMGIETLGTSVRRLRLEVTGLDQDTFAAMCNMSTKALYQIEKDKGNPTISTIDAILRKFGMRLGLTHTAKTTYTPPLGEHKPAAKLLVRGASPQRKYAGQLTRVAALGATAKRKDGDKESTD